MPEIQVRQQFAMPVERTWARLVAVDRYPEWVRSYEEVEFEVEQRASVGTR